MQIIGSSKMRNEKPSYADYLHAETTISFMEFIGVEVPRREFQSKANQFLYRFVKGNLVGEWCKTIKLAKESYNAARQGKQDRELAFRLSCIEESKGLPRNDLVCLRHMLGAASNVPKRQWGFRNYFLSSLTGDDYDSLCRLEKGDMVRLVRKDKDSAFFKATYYGSLVAGLQIYQANRAASV